MLKQRGTMERNVSDLLQINVTIVTLGWQRNAAAVGTIDEAHAVPPAGGLWRPGDICTIDSPMLVQYSQPLSLKAVTFSQDGNSGTRSTLELVNGAAMGNEPTMK